MTASAGSGPAPLSLPIGGEAQGAVYLTGPLDGAPFGLSIVVPAARIGPYDFGDVVTLARITIDPYTTRATITSNSAPSADPLPTIVGGVPVRLRSVSVAVNRSGFMLNPTACSALATESLLSGTDTLPAAASATDHVATPFALGGCSSLGFSPQFTAATGARTSRLGGARLSVRLTPGAGQANLREVSVTLPPQLVSRLSTLNDACPDTQFAAAPASCPAASRVGTATLVTPLLPDPLHGDAYLVSHGGLAFPDLDYVLEGDGVKLIEVSHTDIKHGITSSTFSTLPDAPFTSFISSFPMGRSSLLSANGGLCARTMHVLRRSPVRRHGHIVRRHGRILTRSHLVTRLLPLRLTMPTTLVAQNGKRIEQATPIVVEGCPQTRVKGLKLEAPAVLIRGDSATITLVAPTSGRLLARGNDLIGAQASVRAGRTVRITMHLTRSGRKLLRRRRRVTLSVALRLLPTSRAERPLRAKVALHFAALRRA
ncbi:MAG: hypothetical protein ACYDA6_07330 [Solirubrobacteraceae bacterium]